MGMSASQARLLSITSRMNDVEFKSQQISNTKIRLADESEQVANAYTKALNASKYTKVDYSSGHAVKVDLTARELIKPNSDIRLRRRNDNRVVISQKEYDLYKTAISYNNNKNSFCGQLPTEDARKKESGYVFVLNMTMGVSSWNSAYNQAGIDRINNNTETPYADFVNAGIIKQADIDYYTNLYNQLFDNSTTGSDGQTKSLDGGIVFDSKTLNDASWLYEAIESGEFYLEQTSSEGWKETSVSGNPNLSIETDTTGLAKAEAEYNSKTAKINRKEKLLDNDLKALDTEHSALNTEMDSIKSLIKDNVDKTFNLFS